MATTASSGFKTSIGIKSLSPGTGGICTCSVTAGGTGYSVNDVLTVGQGTGGTLLVVTAGGGIVSAVSRLTPGTGYTVAAGKTTTVVPAGGTGCTINVLTLIMMVAELKSIGGPSLKLNLAEASNMDSPDGYEEFIPAMLSGGEFTVEGNYLNTTGQAQMLADQQAKTVRTFEVIVPFAAVKTWTFTGYIASLEPSAKYREALAFTASIKVSGKPTLA